MLEVLFLESKKKKTTKDNSSQEFYVPGFQGRKTRNPPTGTRKPSKLARRSGVKKSSVKRKPSIRKGKYSVAALKKRFQPPKTNNK